MSTGSQLKILARSYRARTLVLIILLAFEAIYALGQTGVPPLLNYPPASYSQPSLNMGPQNWCVLRDARGLIYVSNTFGILEFDGFTWRLVPGTEQGMFLKMGIDPSGKIITAGAQEFGYLAPDSGGKTIFFSLRDKFEPLPQNLGRIRSVLSLGTTQYFIWDERMLSIEGEQITQVEPKTYFLKGLIYDNNLWIQEHKDQPKTLTGQKVLEFPPYGPDGQYAGIKQILGLPDGTVQFLSNQNGLLDFNRSKSEMSKHPLNMSLKGSQIWNVDQTRNGDLIIGTQGQGTLLYTPENETIVRISREEGLQSDFALYPYADSEGLTWLGLNKGISKLDHPSPLSVYGEKTGIEEVSLSILPFSNKVWMGTGSGINQLEAWPGLFGKIKPLEGFNLESWALLRKNQSNLVATNQGVSIFSKNNQQNLLENLCWSLASSDQFPNQVFVGANPGLFLLTERNGTWELEGEIEGIPQNNYFVELTESGTLWCVGDQIYQVDVSGGASLKAPVVLMDSTHGWSASWGNTRPALIDDQLVLATEIGLYAWQEKEGKFAPATQYGARFADGSHSISIVKQAPNGTVWLSSGPFFGPMVESENGHQWDSLTLATLPWSNIEALEFDEKGVAWIGRSDGLLRYDPAVTYPEDFTPHTLIRKVSLANDSVLFWGGFTDEAGMPSLQQGGHQQIKLASEYRDIQFEFASTSYRNPEKNVYSWKLEGYTEAWSPWSTDHSKEFTNLPGGTYTFRVKSRTVLGQDATEAAFTFSLAKPWYFTTWAFLLYLVLLAGLIYVVVRLNSARLRRANLRLEGIVTERTEEIRLEKIETETQRDRAEASEQVKKRFFANMTHELRTPLTLIIGPVDQVHAESVNAEHRQKLNMVSRNSRKLLRLINQLLDIGKIESDRMMLVPVRLNLVVFLRESVSSFEGYAKEKKIQLHFHSDVNQYPADIDPEKLEKVTYNLLSNALKFTPEGGKVSVELGKGNPGYARILIKDSGIGIPESELPHIFDRYYMVEQGKQSAAQGTGIGLSLVRELVELHGGEITANSVEGIGTEFRIELLETHAGTTESSSPQSTTAPLVTDLSEPAATPATVLTEAQLVDDEALPVVLVIEDNVDIRSYIGSVIGEKFRVMEAENGRSGVEKALEMVPDLVVTDIMMPELDGYGVITALRKDEKTSHIPIIILSSKAESEARLTGFETGAEAYLTKPFLPEELTLRIRKMIELRQQLREKYRNEVLLQPPTRVEATSMEEQFLLNIRTAIEKHLDNEKFGVEDLAAEIGLSRVQLHRKFKALTGQTTNKFIRSYRLNTAMELIKKHSGTISEIAYQVGFSSPSYFTKCFVEEFGMPPSEVKSS